MMIAGTSVDQRLPDVAITRIFIEVLPVTISRGPLSEGNPSAAHICMGPFAPHEALKVIHGTEKPPLPFGSSQRAEKVETSATPLYSRNHSLDMTRTPKNTEYC